MNRLLLAVATLSALYPAGAASARTGAQYVALGSSFAAGPGVGTMKPDTPARCTRSEYNYATLLAKQLALDLDDQTCSSATTPDLLQPWKELPAQIDAVGPATRLVTATIGGNDLGLASYLIAATCRRDGTVEISGHTLPCGSPKLPDARTYVRLEKDLRELVRTVRQRAPKARFVFVQYVSLIPAASCAAAPLSAGQAATARTMLRRLAEITDRAARLEGAQVVEADKLSRRHTICDAQPWSLGAKGVPGQGVLWHPSRFGHARIARLLAERLRGHL